MKSLFYFFLYFLPCILIVGTYGKVEIIPENIVSTQLRENDLSFAAAALHDQNGENLAHQSNDNLQPSALRDFLDASKTVLTSTITNLINTNISQEKLGLSNVANHTVESDNVHTIENTIDRSVLNENTDYALTPSPLNYTTTYDGPTVCVNGTGVPVAPSPTNLSEIPAKEVIIVVLMLSLWIYSIHMTRRAWHRLLKE